MGGRGGRNVPFILSKIVALGLPIQPTGGHINGVPLYCFLFLFVFGFVLFFVLFCFFFCLFFVFVFVVVVVVVVVVVIVVVFFWGGGAFNRKAL